MGSDFQTQSEIQAIIDRDRRSQQANIAQGLVSPEKMFARITLNLDSARTENGAGDSGLYRVGFPFKSVRVEDASDSATYIYIRPNKPEPSQEHAKLGQYDFQPFGNGVADAYLFWPAQAGKTITLVFYFYGDFKSGRVASFNAGGFSINQGSSAATQAKGALSITSTPSVLLAADLTRKNSIIQNHDVESIFIGDANVTDGSGAYPGREIQPGGVYEWANTAALYAVASVGPVTKISMFNLT